jgi:hypothetical protein
MKHIAQGKDKYKSLAETTLEAIVDWYSLGLIDEETYKKGIAVWSEHDCKASPDDGCEVCGKLIDLGIVLDPDPKEEE